MKSKSLSSCLCGKMPEVMKGDRGLVIIRCPICWHKVYGYGEDTAVNKWNIKMNCIKGFYE